MAQITQEPSLIHEPLSSGVAEPLIYWPLHSLPVILDPGGWTCHLLVPEPVLLERVGVGLRA